MIYVGQDGIDLPLQVRRIDHPAQGRVGFRAQPQGAVEGMTVQGRRRMVGADAGQALGRHESEIHEPFHGRFPRAFLGVRKAPNRGPAVPRLRRRRITPR